MHQYQLQKYSGMQSRHRCPACQNRSKTFSLYVNSQTNEPLNARVGRCSREVKCGYHYTPKQWFADESVSPQKSVSPKAKKITTKILSDLQSSGLPDSLFKQTLKAYHRNHLVTYLTHTLGADAARAVVGKYCIGTAKHWPGATVFWQIDVQGKVRAGKIMLYDPTTGKRVKQPFNYITWVHSVLQTRSKEQGAKTKDLSKSKESLLLDPCSFIPADVTLKQCLFGEHLLRGNTLPVAIVESEKTALIASVHLPQYLWLAVGSLSNLSAQRCQVLKGRRVYLFPDLNAYEKWSAKAKTLYAIAKFRVFKMFELRANDAEKLQGLDIGDYY